MYQEFIVKLDTDVDIFRRMRSAMVQNVSPIGGAIFRLYSIKVEFYSNKTKNRFLNYPLGDLGATYRYALHL